MRGDTARRLRIYGHQLVYDRMKYLHGKLFPLGANIGKLISHIEHKLVVCEILA